jgi:integrase
VRSEWNGFFKWLRDIRELIEANPLDRVKAPAQPRRPIEFYELDVVERIVGHQPTEDRRALLALLYGTGMEVSTALQLTRADFNPSTTGGSIHAKGTKAHNRDRIAYVDDWAWDILWPFAKLRIQGKLFGVQSRHTVSKWHSETCKALGLPDVYPLKNARHHWAATHLRAGYQIQFVQKQLGHATPKETLDVYGRFIPSEADHRRFQSVLVALDKERRSAMGGAK